MYLYPGDALYVKPIFGNEQFGRIEFGDAVNSGEDRRIETNGFYDSRNPHPQMHENNAYNWNTGTAMWKYVESDSDYGMSEQSYTWKTYLSEIEIEIPPPVELPDDCDWSNAECWANEEFPDADTNVVIPFGRTITIDTDIDVGYITVDGTLKIKSGLDLNIRTKGIHVGLNDEETSESDEVENRRRKRRSASNSKRFQIGSPDSPFCDGSVTIVLTGHYSQSVAGPEGTPNIGAKAIAAYDDFDIVGCPVGKTSSYLKNNALAGDNQLVLHENVPSAWQVGGQVAIAASGMAANETETFTIT